LNREAFQDLLGLGTAHVEWEGMPVQSKLHIDLSQGVVDVEGDTDLVREIYRDFKDQLLSGAPAAQRPQSRPPAGAGQQQANGETKTKGKRRVAPRKKADGDGGASGINANAPKLDKNLDTSKLGAFYGQFAPKNNYEKILVFLKFITEELGQDEPNTDQVYTCFKKVGGKIPTAFAQAFHDTSSKRGYIDFNSATDISITIAGDNHFNDMMKAAE
jgi:hypothetical protein